MLVPCVQILFGNHGELMFVAFRRPALVRRTFHPTPLPLKLLDKDSQLATRNGATLVLLPPGAWGGTAIFASEPVIQPFDPTIDHTGCYVGLYRTQRLNAAWVQVTPKCRALIVCVYATTGASQDPAVHAKNDGLLFADLFDFIAQFGQSPILAGDFQADPASYPSIASRLAFQNWRDPVATVDENGFSTRPITFSRDGFFSGADDASSSIDAVLLLKPLSRSPA